MLALESAAYRIARRPWRAADCCVCASDAMPTRRSTTASAPQFLRVDKHLSKYTKALNQHLERPIQWGEEGAKHTKGLILVAEAQPAAEISVPNRSIWRREDGQTSTFLAY